MEENRSFIVKGKTEDVKAACAKALERLGVDYIDLFYLHRQVQHPCVIQRIRVLTPL